MSEALETKPNFDAAKFRADLEQLEVQCRDLFDDVKERVGPFEEPRFSIVAALEYIKNAKIGARRL